MQDYRDECPHATITPKLHLLEEHAVEWLQRWRVGFGMMGEQGAESIHAHFNILKRTYSNIPEHVTRLRQLMAEHLLHIAPANISLKPTIKRRRRQ